MCGTDNTVGRVTNYEVAGYDRSGPGAARRSVGRAPATRMEMGQVEVTTTVNPRLQALIPLIMSRGEGLLRDAHDETIGELGCAGGNRRYGIDGYIRPCPED